MRKSILLCAVLLLASSCGPSLRGKRIIPTKGNFGIQGLTNVDTNEDLNLMEEAFKRELPQLPLPKEGESIVYQKNFSSEQQKSFVPFEGATYNCTFRFNKIKVKETLHLKTVDSETVVESTVTEEPIDPEYLSTISMEQRKTTCLNNKAKLNTSETKNVDLMANYRKLSQYMDYHFFKVIKACQNDGELEYGRCLGGNLIGLKSRQDSQIPHYQVELAVTYSKNGQKLTRQMGLEVSSKNVYFQNLGVLNQLGELLRPAKSDLLGVTSIQLIDYRN